MKLIDGAVCGVFDAFSSLYMCFNRLTPLPTGLAMNNVCAIRTGTVNFFILPIALNQPQRNEWVSNRASPEARDCICIDAGFCKRAAAREFERIGFDPSRVAAVFLTHSDIDHTAGLPLFPNARVYLHEREAPLARRDEPRKAKLWYNPRVRARFVTLADGQEAVVGQPEPPASRGSELKAKPPGIRVRAVWTPGHTAGSVSYLVDDRLLFSGDTIRLKNGVASPNLQIFSTDLPAQRASIAKLAALPGVEALFTAHRGWTTDFYGVTSAYRVKNGNRKSPT